MPHILTIVVLALAISSGVANAVTLNDPFSTNPYAPKRWCERFHHVHWDSINLLMSGINGQHCPPYPDPTGCCSFCPYPGCTSVILGFPGGHFSITPIDYTGLTRTAEYTVGFQSPLNGADGEHPTIYTASHPSCHLGFGDVLGVLEILEGGVILA